jgi:hypothetical protein
MKCSFEHARDQVKQNILVEVNSPMVNAVVYPMQNYYRAIFLCAFCARTRKVMKKIFFFNF